MWGLPNYQKWKNRSNYDNIITILAAVYTAERFELQGNFFEPQNPRFIIESGFKSRAGYNGARTVFPDIPFTRGRAGTSKTTKI